MPQPNALILHGKPDRDEYYNDTDPSPSNAHWLPWVQKELLKAGYDAQTPEMPEPFAPDYPRWKAVFERFSVNDQSVLIGHSCGGGFLLRWLSENNVSPRRVILVAPWIDPNRDQAPEFFDFTIDANLCARTELHIFETDNDTETIRASVAKIRKILPTTRYRLFPGYGHFCFNDMKTGRFPELLALALAP